MKNRIVEATVKLDGERVPVGIMSAEMAADLPAEAGMKFSHPEGEPGDGEKLLTQAELQDVVAP